MGLRRQAALGLLCAVLALAGAGALAGCSRSSGSGGGAMPAGSAAGSGAGSAAAPGPAGSPPAGVPSAGSTSPPSELPHSEAAMQLAGQVQAGVEPGCRILQDGGRTYELLGGDPQIVKIGARVRVVGHLAVGVLSHCMQGQPFQVTEAHAL